MAFKRFFLLTVMAGLTVSGCKKKTITEGGGSPSPSPGSSASPSPSPSGGKKYPWLANSCQNMVSHTHGLCFNIQRPDYYPEGPAGETWKFYPALQDAIAKVPKDSVIFDGDGVRPGKEGEYAKKLVEYLDTKGVCAIWDGSISLYMRTNDQDYNEQINFLNQRTRRPTAYGHYICEVSDALIGTVPSYGCPELPEIPESRCGNSQNRYYNDALDILREILDEERPKGRESKLVDFDTYTGWPDYGFRLKDDGVALLWRAVEKAHQRGFCVTHDNWKSFKIRKGNVAETISMVHHYDFPANKPEQTAKCKADGFNGGCESTMVKVEDTCTLAQ